MFCSLQSIEDPQGGLGLTYDPFAIHHLDDMVTPPREK
jgi:hypothetical protein